MVLWPIRMPEKRFHLLEYGLFGGLVCAALLERRRPGGEMRWSAAPAMQTALATGLAGWLDEGMQHLLPNRHYDWAEVGLNLLAARPGDIFEPRPTRAGIRITPAPPP